MHTNTTHRVPHNEGSLLQSKQIPSWAITEPSITSDLWRICQVASEEKCTCECSLLLLFLELVDLTQNTDDLGNTDAVVCALDFLSNADCDSLRPEERLTWKRMEGGSLSLCLFCLCRGRRKAVPWHRCLLFFYLNAYAPSGGNAST